MNEHSRHDPERVRQHTDHLFRFASIVVAAERLEQVFEAALDAIEGALGADRSAVLICDASGVMRFRAWRRLSDAYRRTVEGHSPWPRDAVSPQPVLVPDALDEASLAGYATLFREEGIGSLAFIPVVGNGRLLGKFMLYFARPHHLQENEVQMATSLANHLASVTLRFELIAELRETIRYNETFAGILAHDLRNPLMAIMTAAEVLLREQEGQPSAGARPVGRILTSAERMARMIEQLLDFTLTRVGGGIEVRPKHANLAELCEQAVGELELGHPEWQIEQTTRGDAEGTWDHDRLLQVISNLVANAGQHGRPGAPVRVEIDGTRSDIVLLRVENDGAVPAAILPTLFDPYRSTRRSGPSRSRGLGLGLFITKQVVGAHGGELRVESSELSGTAVVARLPRHSVATRPSDKRTV